ncbi:hypothetical protein Tco_1380820, partial [Tanacetum coccineum]
MIYLARVASDKDLVQHFLFTTGEKYSEEDLPRKLMELVNQREEFFAQQRAKAKRNKPMAPAQQKAYMSTYIKNQEGVTLLKISHLPLSSSKRQKIGEGSKLAEESNDELSQEQLQQLMIIVPEEGMNVENLQTKYPIIEWEVYTKDSRKYWKIIKVGSHTEVYLIFENMLKNFDRDDLVKLWSLVHERFNSTKPTEDKERELWVELKRLFEPDDDDTLWKLQRYMHDPFKWRLYDTYVVHHVSTERGHDIFMLVEKDYPLIRALMTLMLCNKLQVDEYSVMTDELLRKIFILENRPRQSVKKGSTDEVIHEERGDSVERAATTTSSLEAEQDSVQSLSRVNTLGSGEDKLKLKELMDLCTKLSDRVLDLETTKTAQAKEIASLKKRGRYDDAQMFDTYVFNDEEVFVVEQSEKVVEEVVSTTEVSVVATITTEEITLAQALAELR